MLERNSDAYKLLFAYQRPRHAGAEDIGSWQKVLEFLGLFSIITNCWLLGYTSNVIRDMSGSANTLQVVVILEHCLLITKLWIAAAVPDMPRDVARALTKQD